MNQFLFLICFSFLSFFNADQAHTNIQETISTEVSDYYVYVHVSRASGGNYASAKVQGKVCGSLGGMTQSVYTDSKGYAKLTFSSSDSLCKIYINGTTREGNWTSGETASFTER